MYIAFPFQHKTEATGDSSLKKGFYLCTRKKVVIHHVFKKYLKEIPKFSAWIKYFYHFLTL